MLNNLIKLLTNYLKNVFVNMTLVTYKVLINPFWITDTTSTEQLELSREAYYFVVNCLLLHMPRSEILEQGKLKGWVIPIQVLDFIEKKLMENPALGMTPEDFIHDLPNRLRLPPPKYSRSPEELAEIKARIAAEEQQDYLNHVGAVDFDEDDIELESVVPPEVIIDGCRMIVTGLIVALLAHHAWTVLVQSMDEEPVPLETSSSYSAQDQNAVSIKPSIPATSSTSVYQDPSLHKEEDTLLNAFNPYSDLYYVMSLWLSILFLFTLGIGYLKWKKKHLNHGNQSD